MSDVRDLTPDNFASQQLDPKLHGQVHSDGQYVAVVLDRTSFQRLVMLLDQTPTGDPHSMSEVYKNAVVASGGMTFALKNVTVTLTID